MGERDNASAGMHEVHASLQHTTKAREEKKYNAEAMLLKMKKLYEWIRNVSILASAVKITGLKGKVVELTYSVGSKGSVLKAIPRTVRETRMIFLRW